MPARYVQYSHARTLNYLNCLRYTIVDSMPPVMLETMRMLDKVRELEFINTLRILLNQKF